MKHRQAISVESTAQAFGELRVDYNAAKTGRFRKQLSGVAAMGSHADFHYRNESQYLRMMELARNFDRNDMVVGQGITRLINNVLQDGMKVDPQTGDDEADERIADLWRSWTTDADQCHISGELTFRKQAELVLRSVIVDGDIIVLPLKNGSLEYIEAHRIRRPKRTTRNVVHGFLLDEVRRRLEVWITKEDLDPSRPLIRVGDVRRLPIRDRDGRRQVLQIYNPKRMSQTRGITHMAPTVDAIGMHDDLEFAKLVQAQVSSCFALLRERELEFQGTGAPATGAAETETLADGSSRTLVGIAPGMEWIGSPGEKLSGFSPNVPNPEFFDHAKLILTFVAVNLDLPLAVLLLDPSQTNFSGWRGAMDQARLGFRNIQSWLIDLFFRPVYLWKIAQWSKSIAELRRLEGSGEVDLYRHCWTPPSWPYIEPLKDAKADEVRLNRALISLRRVHAERGRDWGEVAKEIVADRALLIEIAAEVAAELSKKHPDERFSWHDLVPEGFIVRMRKEGRPGAKTTPTGDQPAANALSVRTGT